MFRINCFSEAVARGLDDASNDQLKGTDLSGIRLPFNYKLLKKL